MKLNHASILDIKDAASEQLERYAITTSVLNDLAGENAITWEEVERISNACQPVKDKYNRIISATNHALAISSWENGRQMPFMKAPAPLTEDELTLLETAWNSFFNI